MKKISFTLLLIVSLFMTACSNENTANATKENSLSEPTKLTISAAVSLTDALEEIQSLYEKENNVELTFNLGGSGTLAQQILQGAPVDVFISANEKWMDTVEDEEQIMPTTRNDVTGNKIVLIAQKDSPLHYASFKDISLDEVDQIAIGNPESVPAGSYTEQILTHIDLWDALESSFVYAKDVRQVLTYVESGNTDIGFVYESDARTSDTIKILANAEQDWHEPIIYPGAVLADTKNKEEATAFLQYLDTEEAQDIFKKYGFSQHD